jgi:hypothetical protein
MSKPLFQRLGLFAATALTAATLVACGGDSSAPAKVVATQDLGIEIKDGTAQAAAIVAELTKAPYTFKKDITLNGAVYIQPVTITVTGTTKDNLRFRLVDSSTPTAKDISGDLTFGSCKFLRDIGGPAVAFAPCTTTLKTNGQTFTPGADTSINLLWNLDGTNPSDTLSVTVRVSSDGQVNLVNSDGTLTTLGTVTVTNATGATGT